MTAAAQASNLAKHNGSCGEEPRSRADEAPTAREGEAATTDLRAALVLARFLSRPLVPSAASQPERGPVGFGWWRAGSLIGLLCPRSLAVYGRFTG